MKRIGSADFRRTYAQLTEPSEVTANGRVIGVWTPVLPVRISDTETVESPTGVPQTPQQARDAVLHRINRGRA